MHCCLDGVHQYAQINLRNGLRTAGPCQGGHESPAQARRQLAEPARSVAASEGLGLGSAVGRGTVQLAPAGELARSRGMQADHQRPRRAPRTCSNAGRLGDSGLGRDLVNW